HDGDLREGGRAGRLDGHHARPPDRRRWNARARAGALSRRRRRGGGPRLLPVLGDFAEGMMHGDGPARIGYATGWLVHALPEGRIIEHGGTTYGYTSAVRFDPDRRIGVIVLTNLAHQGGLAGPV